jgi:ubiquinone/menaquinone biosynthesis C-methylase UbiE
MALIGRAAIQPGEKVLDVACGTGIVARLAAEKAGPSGSVSAVDINPAMLAVARSVTPAEMAIQWYQASAEDMPLPDGSFDVVLCQMGLQFMDDPAAALREMRRVLVPQGRILLNMPGPAGALFTVLADEIERHLGPQPAGFVQQVFSLNDTERIEQLLTDAGLREVRVEAGVASLQLPPARDFLWQYLESTPLATPLGAAPESKRSALEQSVVSRWRPMEQDGRLAGEQRMVMATGRR